MSSRAVPQIRAGGRILRHARRHAGLTQRALEEKSGVPQETIARIEASRTSPRFDTLVHLLAVCGFELEVHPKKGIGIDVSQIGSMLAMTPTDQARFAILRTLADAGVRFVVIGGVAANYVGSRRATDNLDICYGRDPANLEALAKVLRELGHVLRGPFADTPKGDSFTFTTAAGDLNVLGMPSGTKGYDDLVRAATGYDVDGARILVASIDDLIRMKRAAGRDKDRVHLEHLGALRDELDRPRASSR
jgi:transcriptional regulator with XRE-family HTH domain